MANKLWETYWSDENQHDWWKRPAPEVLEFIKSQSPEEKPDVLDLGCGLGRHAIEFAKAGFQVTATDASETAIENMNEWAKKLNYSFLVGKGFERENPWLSLHSFDNCQRTVCKIRRKSQ